MPGRRRSRAARWSPPRWRCSPEASCSPSSASPRASPGGCGSTRSPTRSVLALAYLVVFGSLLAFSAYIWLLHRAPLPLVATYAYVNPVVAVLLGWTLLDEPITPRMILAGGIIVVAVALIAGASPPPVAEDEPAARRAATA